MALHECPAQHSAITSVQGLSNNQAQLLEVTGVDSTRSRTTTWTVGKAKKRNEFYSFAAFVHDSHYGLKTCLGRHYSITMATGSLPISDADPIPRPRAYMGLALARSESLMISGPTIKFKYVLAYVLLLASCALCTVHVHETSTNWCRSGQGTSTKMA